MSMTGRDVMGETQRLFEERVVEVDGPVSDKTKDWLGEKLRSISAYARYAMEEMGLYSRHDGTEFLKADPIEPDSRGLYGGYTNGFRKAVNAYIVPLTKYYGKFQDWLKGERGKIAEYLYDNFGTPEKAEESTEYILTHEELHDLTQIWEMETENGEVIKPFQEKLWNELVGRYERNLPKGLKPLAYIFARLSFTPLLEGMNEVCTENILNGKTADQVRMARSKEPTVYDKYTKDAAQVLFDMDLEPGYEVLDVYRDPGKLKLRRYIDQNPNTIPIPTMSSGGLAMAA